jgi:O-antigen/teichoic acid export membrane protein
MLARKIGYGTLRIFLAESLALPAGLFIAILLSRMLGPAGYGRYGVAVAIVINLEWLVVAGYSRISVQLLTDSEAYDRMVPAFLRLYLFSSLAVMAGLCALANVFASLLKAPYLGPDLRWLSLDIPLFALAYAQRSLLTARHKYSARAAGTAIRWITRAALTWALLALGWGILGALWAWPLASLAELLLRQLPLTALLRSGDKMTSIWREGWGPFLFAFGQKSLDRMDLVLVQAFGIAPAAVGIYVAAQNLAILPGLFSASLAPVLIAAMTQERLGGRELASRQTAAQSLRLIMCLLPLAPVFAICGSDLAAFAFGPPYREAGHLLGWLMAGSIGLVLASASVSIISAQGRHRLSPWFSLPAAGIGLILQLLIIPRYGILGAAMVTAGIGLSSGICGTIFVFRGWRQSFPVATLVRVASISLVLLVASSWNGVLSLAWPIRFSSLILACLVLLLISGEWKLQQVRAFLAPAVRL